MTYIKWRDADGYETGSRECLDLPAFAADLCKALHGKPISTNDRDGHATFELADGCRLSLSNNWRSTRPTRSRCTSIRPMNWTASGLRSLG